MTITSLDVIDIMYAFIKDSVLMTGENKPNGGLYKQTRPINSASEDCVLNALPFNRDDVQQGIINFNIYVPNLQLHLNGVTDNTQPNYKRLKQLSIIANSVLDDVWSDNASYTFNVQQDNIFSDPDNNQHYINFRIEFYSPNN